jgi:hypothetical protein
MAIDNKLELVVEIDTNRANASVIIGWLRAAVAGKEVL